MNRQPLIIEQLTIRRMPGFPRGMASYDDFAQHINIIAGPNASGKSSTARMIQGAIWQHDTEGIDAGSSMLIGDDKWDVKIDHKQVKVQCNGIDDELRGLPSADAGKRYMLAFHELIDEDEQALAKRIAQESIGGYDLNEAKIQLDYSNKPKSKSTSEYKAFVEKEKAYKRSLEEQKRLSDDADKLEQLYRQRTEADEASKLQELYEKVCAYLQAKKDYDLRAREYEAFPEILARVNGNELKTIEELEQEIEEAEEALRHAHRTREKCEEALAALHIPQEGIGQEILDELQERINRGDDLSRQLQQKDEDIAALEEKAGDALAHIDDSIDPREWEGLQLKDVSGLDEFLQEAHQLLSEQQFLNTEIEKLKEEGEPNSHPRDTDTLRQGITSLSYWLHETQSVYGIQFKWLLILTLLGIVTALMSFLLGWPGLIGIVLMIGVAFYAYNTRSTSNTNVRQDDYRKTGLPFPNTWQVEDVVDTLDKLVEELKRSHFQEKIEQRIHTSRENLKALQNRLDQMHQQYEQWQHKLQAVPDLPQEHLSRYAGLYWFLSHAREWQKNRDDADSLRAKKKQINAEWQNNIKRINELLNGFWGEQVDDIPRARAALKKLTEEETKRSQNQEEIRRLNDQIQDKQTEKAKRTDKLQEVYDKLNLSFGQKEEVRSFINQLPAYKEAKSQLDSAQTILEREKQAMEEHSLFPEHKETIQTIHLDEAEQKHEEYNRTAEKLASINKEITEIETKINEAKASHDTEEALAAKDCALDDLARLYESNLASMTGNLLVDALQEESHPQNRSKVFEKADRLLNRMTSGRYELRLAEKDRDAFRAYDNVLQEGQQLSELSTGTRVQLLLAVRLAFIETQESSVKLPILADELLANSDDVRAQAIIDALIEISKEGRQVFYFTAQRDEMAKWQAYLAQFDDISYQTFTLSGLHNEEQQYEIDAQSSHDFRFNEEKVPPPANHNHEEYRNLLDVPGFHILRDELSQIHLWYLIEDPELLYRCLINHINRWGQLASFIDHKGELEGLDDATIQQLEDRVKFLERFQALYKKGRSLPINREVLVQSGAVSDAFIDDVSAVLTSHEGDPQKLLEALYDGDVSGFRHNKKQELERFLIDEGYIDEQQPLSRDDILVQLRAFMSHVNLTADEAESLIQRVLGKPYSTTEHAGIREK